MLRKGRMKKGNETLDLFMVIYLVYSANLGRGEVLGKY